MKKTRHEATKRRSDEGSREKLARAIARDLFTDGVGRRAVRLVVVHEENDQTKGMGGWSERAMGDRIARRLKFADRRKRGGR